MFKKETGPIVCSRSRQTQAHSWAGVSFLPVQEGQWPPACHPAWHSSPSLPFTCPSPPPPWEGLLFPSPKREDFSIWQLGMRLLAGFPPFAPLDLTSRTAAFQPHMLFQGEFTIEILSGTDINSLIRKLVCLKGYHACRLDGRRFPESLQSISRQKLEPK